MKQVFILTGISRGLGKSLFDCLCSTFEDCQIIGIGKSFTAAQYDIEFNSSDRVKLIYADFSTQFNLEKIPVNFNRDSCIHIILNAGVIEPIGNVGTTLDNEFISCVHINFISHARLCNYLLHTFGSKKNISIINVSSAASQFAKSGWSAYCSSKAAMRMYLDCLAKEYPFVRVHHIDPGMLDTDMQKKIRDTSPEVFAEVTRFRALKQDGKLKDPVEVAMKIIQEIINSSVNEKNFDEHLS